MFQIKFDNIKERVIFSRINPTESLAGVSAVIAVVAVAVTSWSMVPSCEPLRQWANRPRYLADYQ